MKYNRVVFVCQRWFGSSWRHRPSQRQGRTAYRLTPEQYAARETAEAAQLAEMFPGISE